MAYDQQIAFIIYLQHYVWPLPIMQLATAIGSVEFYLLIVSAIYWCIDTRLGFRLGLILMISQGLNDSLKIAFHTPRPYWVSRKVIASTGYSSFGIPSGHAQNAVCTWGYLANFLNNAWAWVAAFILIILIGISRIYLGAHFPIDVAIGWTTGAFILTAVLRLEPKAAVFLQNLDLRRQILISFLASIVLLALFYLCLMALGSWHLPSSWAENAMAATGTPINPLTRGDILVSAGTLFGMGTGYSWLCRRYKFSVGGHAVVRLLRYILGIAVLALIWFGIGAIRLHQPLLISYIIDYLQAMIASIWVAAAAPVLFVKAGLAEKEI